MPAGHHVRQPCHQARRWYRHGSDQHFWLCEHGAFGMGNGQAGEYYGWDAAFWVLLIATFLGTLLFTAAWPAKADGYAD